MTARSLAVVAALSLGASVACADQMAKLPYQGEGHILVNADALKWRDVASMAPGAKMAILEGDPANEEPFTFRLTLPANYRIDPHVHPAYERVTVLSGTFHFAHGEKFDRAQTKALSPGGFAVMAPGEPMFGYTEKETVVQLHGTGPWGIEYLNPEDDPRKQ